MEGTRTDSAEPSAPLDVERIRRQCVVREINALVLYLPEVESTNDEIRLLAPPAPAGMTALFTDFQRSGRGRLGRVWTAPPRSSILVSIRMPWPSGVPLTQSTMLAGLSVAEAIAAVTGLHPALKWPNDVVIAGGKVAGILAESDPGVAGAGVIIGMGVNGNFDPATLTGFATNATTLAHESGFTIDRTELAIALLERLQVWKRVLTRQPDAVFGEWKTRLDTLGRTIVVDDGNETWEGTALTVDRQGGLVVDTGRGYYRTVYAANISVRPRPTTHRAVRSVE